MFCCAALGFVPFRGGKCCIFACIGCGCEHVVVCCWRLLLLLLIFLFSFSVGIAAAVADAAAFVVAVVFAEVGAAAAAAAVVAAVDVASRAGCCVF